MKSYVIYLKENGDGFNVREYESFKEICDTHDTPECITKALSCRNRKEVENYINHYLSGLKKDQDNKYLISNLDETQTQVALYHDHFHDKDTSFSGHFSIKGRAHEEAPDEMLQFVRDRSAFFVKNYTTGKEYQNISWLNPSWIVTFLEYYLIAFKNSLSHTLIGGFLLGIEPSHFCEDFNLGYKSLEESNLSNQEVSSLGLYC